MNPIDSLEYLLGQLLKNAFRQRSNRVEQVRKAPVGGKIKNYRSTPFWTTPKSFVYSYVLLSMAEFFPSVYPLFKNFSHVSVGQRHFFDAENF